MKQKKKRNKLLSHKISLHKHTSTLYVMYKAIWQWLVAWYPKQTTFSVLSLHHPPIGRKGCATNWFRQDFKCCDFVECFSCCHPLFWAFQWLISPVRFYFAICSRKNLFVSFNIIKGHSQPLPIICKFVWVSTLKNDVIHNTKLSMLEYMYQLKLQRNCICPSISLVHNIFFSKFRS